jgi:hypothetical protein
MVKAYCTYVRPLLEYCSPVWPPHTHCLIDKIEKVQRFFRWRVAGLWAVPYTARFVVLNLQTLEYLRIFCDLVLCYNKINTDLANVFKLNSNSITRGHTLKLYKFQCRLDYTKYYFTNRVTTLYRTNYLQMLYQLLRSLHSKTA